MERAASARLFRFIEGSKMEFPSTADFLEAFGIEPVEEDPGMAYCRYVKQSGDGLQELDISFSAVAKSFQVVLRCGGRELVSVSSEKVRLIKLRRDHSGSGIHVVFDVRDGTSEAVVTLEPDLRCHWWTLRS
ncbi:hypothetical protein [Allochromatium vinosum]|uniref:hypothetical protein n=1 Tax=Allochromatium vinosum TaxID=1049 RepID=UPI00190771D6|nr:hypothetical protein [Allochromatium vinosum]